MEHGLYEAGLEGIGNAVAFGFGKYIFNEAVKGGILKPIAAAGGTLGVEADIARFDKERSELEAKEERAAIQAEVIADNFYQEGSSLTDADLMKWLDAHIEYSQDEINEADTRASEIESRRTETLAASDSAGEAQSSGSERDGNGAVKEGARRTAKESLTLTGQTNAQAAAQFAKEEAQRKDDEEKPVEPASKLRGEQVDMFNTQGSVFDAPAANQSLEEFSRSPYQIKIGDKLIHDGVEFFVKSGNKKSVVAETSPVEHGHGTSSTSTHLFYAGSDDLHKARYAALYGSSDNHSDQSPAQFIKAPNGAPVVAGSLNPRDSSGDPSVATQSPESKPRTEKEAKTKAPAANRPKKLTEKQKASNNKQKAFDILGAHIGDTVTFDRDIDYITGGKPMVLDSVGRTTVSFRDPIRDSGTSVSLYLVAGMKEQGLLDWTVTPVENEAIPDVSQKAEKLDTSAEGKPAAIADFGEKLETDNGVAIYSKNDTGPLAESEWLSVAAITDHLEQLRQPFGTAIPVTIVDRLSGVDARIADDSDVATSGVVVAGKIFLIREGLDDRAAVARTFWHELFHFGLRRFLTREQYVTHLGELYASDDWIRNKADAWIAGSEGRALHAKGDSSKYIKARGVDEALAGLAETLQGNPSGYQNNDLVSRAIRAVRSWVAGLAEFFGNHEAASVWRNYAAQDAARDLVVSTFAKLREGAPPSMLTTNWHYSDPAFMAARDTAAPRFVSQLAKAIASIPDRLSVQPAAQWKLWIASNSGKLGVKKDEIVWSGVNDYLDLMGKAKVSKDEVLAYLSENGTQVKDVVLGAKRWEVTDDSGAKELFETESAAKEWRANMRDAAGNYTADVEPFRYDDTQWQVTDSLGSESDGFSSEEDAQQEADDWVQKFESEIEDSISVSQSEDSDTKFSQYVVPGGNNYRELLITLPKKEIVRSKDPALTSPLHEETKFQSSHFDQPNILVHLRMDERTDSDGNRVLFLQEIQSDWGQEGKKEGFSNGAAAKIRAKLDILEQPTSDQIDALETEARQQGVNFDDVLNLKLGVPSAPFVTDTKSWVALALKKAIMYAVQNGMTRVAWANGEQNAAHYDLSKQVDTIGWLKHTDGTITLGLEKDGREFEQRNVEADKLSDFIGKDPADKILNSSGDSGELTGLDLKVGGEGMRAFYDAIVPQVANDVLKKLGGGKVETVRFLPEHKIIKRGNEYQVWTHRLVAHGETEAEARSNALANGQMGFTITDAMLAKVSEGVPLFSRQSGIGSPSHRAAVEYVAKPLLEGLANTPGLIVVQNSNELPFAAEGDAQGVFWRGNIYLVADNIASADDTRNVVAHELMGHFGLRGFFGNRLDGVLNDIHGHNPRVRALAKAWMGNNRKQISDLQSKYGLSDADIKALSIEEALAGMAGRGEKLTGWKSLAAILQSLLRAIGLHRMANSLEAKTDAEALLALKKAEMFVKRGWTSSTPIPDAAYPLFMTAWHGSPHDHNKFDMGKVGTGEGAQAYGWGLYFAGRKVVAKWYRDKLTKYTIKRNGDVVKDPPLAGDDTKGFALYFAFENIRDELKRPNGVRDLVSILENVLAWQESDFKMKTALDEAQSHKKKRYREKYFTFFENDRTAQIEATRMLLEEAKSGVLEIGKGRLYTVELAPSEDEYLDWDKPLSEQSKTVKEALKEWSNKQDGWYEENGNGKRIDIMRGKEIYKTISKESRSGKAASDYLHSLGIRGIRYLDGSSRSAGEGNSNYVIFNDEDVSITAKYSLAPHARIPLAEQLSVSELTQVIENLLAKFRHKPPVVISETESEVGGPVADDDVVVSGLTKAGKIYLFRDGIADTAEAARVLWHELLHYGLRRFMNKEQYIASMANLYNRDAWIKRFADEWLKQTTDDVKQAKAQGMAYARARGVDEALASIAEKNGGEHLNDGVLDKIHRAILNWMAWLSERFGNPVKAAQYRGLTKDEARKLIRDTFSKLREDAPANREDNFASEEPAAWSAIVQRAQNNAIHFFGNQPASKSLKTFNAYDKTIATQLHKALKDPHFGKVFNLVNALQNEVALTSIRPAELAPGVLPRADGVKSAAKQLWSGKKSNPELSAASVLIPLFSGHCENDPRIVKVPVGYVLIPLFSGHCENATQMELSTCMCRLNPFVFRAL